MLAMLIKGPWGGAEHAPVVAVDRGKQSPRTPVRVQVATAVTAVSMNSSRPARRMHLLLPPVRIPSPRIASKSIGGDDNSEGHCAAIVTMRRKQMSGPLRMPRSSVGDTPDLELHPAHRNRHPDGPCRVC